MKITGSRISVGLPMLPMLLILFALVSAAFGQTGQRDSGSRKCSIQGRVIINGQPAANVQVVVSEIVWPQRKADGSPAGTNYPIHTDVGGLYRVTGLAAGTYSIGVSSPELVPAESSLNPELRHKVTLDEGESRDNVDFDLMRGGTITGKVTDSEGRPVSNGRITLFRVEADGKMKSVSGRDAYDQINTDNRGIYRTHGLQAGRYVISIDGSNIRSSNGAKHLDTYYPDTVSRLKAGIIELKSGEEKTGIDVRLVPGGKRYQVLGSLVDEETGKPLSKISLTCSKVAGLNNSQEHDSCGFAGTDAQGNFRFPGLTSGRYSVSILTGREEANNHYLKDAHFDLLDDDLSGIEFKATVGEVISGVVVVEGGAKVNLSAVRLIFMIQLKRGAVSFFPSSPMIAPKADGTFRLGGLPPSTVRLQVVDFGRSSIQFLRLERDGSEVTSNLVIGSDEKNTALRLVVGQGKAVIRGQVEFVGEPLPKGWQLVASARHSATQTAIQRGILESVGPREVDVDEKGRFVLEGLLGGEHEVTVVARPPRDIAGKASRPAPATQKVSITSGEEIQITVNFDTALQSKGQKP
ncbi:MAG TPA: carboxypeptidase-like regulatory domain-containing protein [Blastocatellia bacterium]|nr:carboxypeptidase-like regulatory domain-containing protein [Blastocatellia bacterium]HMV84232.1 carboxypeptidase-like regulatory domain-containing protein [Blastocatellia bacterium]HMX27000.1 carboxypeptidase-like regulatory domain-containing protein [Blastocatellia bacterium]HMY72485.1 carboxypeptidase-like regulatory domain-containing protein [Blastocatellia bacterium]HMZ21921.1 carboxypeptidase-like regulatory domain-containing protein [Blastocatellia bacterium]